jgi:hypothetical protein
MSVFDCRYQIIVQLFFKMILLLKLANLFLRRRDGRAVECGGLENR